MRKALLLGSVAAIALLVACATQDDGGAAASAASSNDTTVTGRGTSRTGGRGTTGVITVPTTNSGSDGGAAPVSNADGGAAALGCYAGHGTCEPTNPTACGAGETCDINGGSGAFQCFPPPNDAKLGEACDNGNGPFCAQGLACNAGVCATYCCDDSVCAAGTTCQATGQVGTIAVKVCL